MLNLSFLNKPVKVIDIDYADIYVRRLTLKDLDTLKQFVNDESETQLIDLVMFACVNEKGQALFKPADREKLIAELPIAFATAVQKAFMVANNL